MQLGIALNATSAMMKIFKTHGLGSDSMIRTVWRGRQRCFEEDSGAEGRRIFISQAKMILLSNSRQYCIVLYCNCVVLCCVVLYCVEIEL